MARRGSEFPPSSLSSSPWPSAARAFQCHFTGSQRCSGSLLWTSIDSRGRPDEFLLVICRSCRDGFRRERRDMTSFEEFGIIGEQPNPAPVEFERAWYRRDSIEKIMREREFDRLARVAEVESQRRASPPRDARPDLGRATSVARTGRDGYSWHDARDPWFDELPVKPVAFPPHARDFPPTEESAVQPPASFPGSAAPAQSVQADAPLDPVFPPTGKPTRPPPLKPPTAAQRRQAAGRSDPPPQAAPAALP